MDARPGPLHGLHESLGARFTEFSGYQMPVMYQTIKAEHEAVRSRVGLFDVSHMGNLHIRGPGAGRLLDRATVADISDLDVGAGVYTVMLREDGAIIDDTIVYRTGEDAYDMVPNAGLATRVVAHLEGLGVTGATIEDRTADTCIFALQGPSAPSVLAGVGAAIDPEPRFRIHAAQVAGVAVQVATTGYTGETGYELFVPVDAGVATFRALLDAGADSGIVPVGLGARDTLRLEMGYALAGHEFAGGRSPLAASLGWTIKWDHDFVGKESLTQQKEAGTYDRLVGLRIIGRGIPREGYPVTTPDGAPVGVVTSGTLSPTLGYGIALAYVPFGQHKAGTPLAVTVRGRAVEAEVTRPPFLRRTGAK